MSICIGWRRLASGRSTHMSPAEELAKAAHAKRLADKECAKQAALDVCALAGVLYCGPTKQFAEGAALARAGLQLYDRVKSTIAYP